MSREFVDSISVGNNLEAEKAFKDSIASKVGDALEVKRKEISRTFVSSATGHAIDTTTDKDEQKEYQMSKIYMLLLLVLIGVVGYCAYYCEIVTNLVPDYAIEADVNEE